MLRYEQFNVTYSNIDIVRKVKALPLQGRIGPKTRIAIHHPEPPDL